MESEAEESKADDILCLACGKHIPENEWILISDGVEVIVECPSCGDKSTDLGWW